MATTRADLRRHCSLTLGLDNTTSSAEQLLMNDWADEAVRETLLDTHCVKRSDTISLTTGVGDYILTNALLSMDDRFETDSGQVYRIARVSVDEILEYRRASSVSNDVPRYYAQEGDTLMLYPAPATNGTITVWGVPRPTSMDTDARDPFDAASTYGKLPIYAWNAVLFYMLWKGALYDEKRSPFTPDQYGAMYAQECAKVRKRFRRMGGRRLTGARVGYPTRVAFPHRNDVYPGYER